ncbi:MAG: hypothetical protein IKO03_06605 [Lachnospiraceae bacterium]|nr:hypothetical protein [Lachnospiraceae bacterium]
MRKIIAVISMLAIVLVMSFPSRAATEASANVFPGLKYNGTTATCSLMVFGEHTTDSIVASVTLKHGSSTVKQWTNLTANGYMNFSDTANVVYGETYTMYVTLEINGVSYPVANITKTCN